MLVAGLAVEEGRVAELDGLELTVGRLAVGRLAVVGRLVVVGRLTLLGRDPLVVGRLPWVLTVARLL